MQSLDPAVSTIPPELTGPVPRSIRFDPVTLLFPVVMVLFFTGAPTYLLTNQIHQQDALRQNSSEAVGEDSCEIFGRR